MTRFFYGLILGVLGMHLFSRIREAHLQVSWYVWVMAICSLVLGTLAVQHFFASNKELERRAAWVGLAFLGIPAVIFALFTAWLIMSA